MEELGFTLVLVMHSLVFHKRWEERKEDVGRPLNTSSVVTRSPCRLAFHLAHKHFSLVFETQSTLMTPMRAFGISCFLVALLQFRARGSRLLCLRHWRRWLCSLPSPLIFPFACCCTQNDGPLRGSSHCGALRLIPEFPWQCWYRAKSSGRICTQTNCICILVGVHNYHFMKITTRWGAGGGGGLLSPVPKYSSLTVEAERMSV